MLINFFVYGSLMTGLHNHRVINPKFIESIEHATIENVELYSYIGGGFPCLLEGNSKVVGEIITIKEDHLNEALKAMDRLEGYNENGPKRNNLYNREVKTVMSEDGSLVDAYVYMFNQRRSLGERIVEGNWRTWRTNK